MTRDEVEAQIALWAKRLHLEHWQIDLAADPPPDDATDLGAVRRHGAYDYATIYVNEAYAGWTLRMVQLVLVHELMHLHTRDVEYAGESVGDTLASQARILWRDRFGHEIEALVDKMATLLVDAYQAPDAPL